MASKPYRVKTGMNYGPEHKRLEPGDLTPPDFPESSVDWLIAQRHLEPVATPDAKE